MSRPRKRRPPEPLTEAIRALRRLAERWPKGIPISVGRA